MKRREDPFKGFFGGLAAANRRAASYGRFRKMRKSNNRIKPITVSPLLNNSINNINTEIASEMKAIRNIVLTCIEKKDSVCTKLTANEYFELYGCKIIKDHYKDVGFMEKKDELIAFLIDNCNKFVNDTYEKNKKYDPIVTFGGALFVFCVPALIIWGIIAAVYGATR